MSEKIRLLDELRAAVRNFTPQREVQAKRSLTEARLVNIEEAIRFGQALSQLRATFTKLDEWEQRGKI